ncbi:MAG TPA: ABC transporter permease subunit, partial [Candidatus Polarisedimenticolia bacterium]|nr:ABC transporter permease subunit [Candidatus Polarisedimenticolia bacterium]
LVPVGFVAGWLSIVLGMMLERGMPGGSFQRWLAHLTGTTYDQRNALVVGIAMGFAVIPIIFTIAEDSLSGVPRHLTAGSLALGATRWQTALRVVVPTASPGIFSAVMIGFGRAVGETMIVLMATGNTPIMDPSIFNGFRALSANIAVELPEAPEAGTLFRVLFVAAALLFAMTFLVNTAAEVVRLRLQRRFRNL